MYRYIILLLLVMSCFKPVLPHECNFGMCPYKGIKKPEYSHAVKVYTQSTVFDEAYKIDMLHLKYPNLEYDDLLTKLK